MTIPLLRKPSIPIFSALPTGLGAGDHGALISYTADQNAGVQWLLQYRHFQNDGVTVDPSAYRWHFLSGSDLWSEIDTGQNIATSGYTDFGTVGPQITAPLAGDYDLHYGSDTYNGTATSADVYLSPAIGATAPLDADAAHQFHGGGTGDNISRRRIKTGLTANTVIKLQGRVSNTAATTSFGNRYLRARPVRVG